MNPNNENTLLPLTEHGDGRVSAVNNLDEEFDWRSLGAVQTEMRQTLDHATNCDSEQRG